MAKHSLETILTRAWLRRGPLACALWPVSLLLRLIQDAYGARVTRLPGA